MAEFESEEMSSLKRWWDANGTAVIIGALVGVVIIVGWQGWRWYVDNQASAAANAYQQFQQGLDSGTVNDDVIGIAKRLQDDFSGTPYAADAALRLAGYYVTQQDYAKAREQLAWAMDNADNAGIRHLARVRAARLAWSQDKPDEALQMLDTEHPPAFTTLYAEVRGDILAARGDRAAAYQAYQLALESLPPDAPKGTLESKAADIAPAAAADAPSESKSTPAS